MNIPFEKLYDYISSRFGVNCVIYRFLPHGSRKLADLTQLNDIDLAWTDLVQSPTVLIHDQEPLWPEFYNHSEVRNSMPGWFANNMPLALPILDNPRLLDYLSHDNLASVRKGFTIYDKNILLHSELNSRAVDFYQAHGFETVYWWSHAAIARDWYRYAEADPNLLPNANVPPTLFNVYNRAWSGPREYRMKFADLVLDAGLQKQCMIRFARHDRGTHWRDHQFQNPLFQPVNDLECLPENQTEAWFSADYNAKDYKKAWWDVVLETMFDDSRVHLTEKILRPIACEKPFICAAGPGSLAMLQSYGFETFSELIDESYDQEHDSMRRLEKIINAMQQISSWTAGQKVQAHRRIAEIVSKNKRRFFSRDFLNHVFDELDINFAEAFTRCQQHRQGLAWSRTRALARHHPTSRTFFTESNYSRSRSDIAAICKVLRRTRRR
jgi:hypothetical protein